MKKLPFKRRSKSKEAIPGRITNETVAEHRERILAGGRRFKYPMQYAKHKLVFNTIIVTVAALLLITLVGWQQLYLAQNTSSFFYRVTRVIPLPVGSVDGEPVRYSAYLMYYSSSSHYLQQSEQVNLTDKDGKRRVDFIKRKSMDHALTDAYANKLARELHIDVDEQQVDDSISDQRNTATGRVSQETYDASVLSILGWTKEEYRQATKSGLIRQDVAYAIDNEASKVKQKAVTILAQPNADFDKAAAELGGTGAAKVTAGISGLVPLTNQDGGLSRAAAKLELGKISGVIKTTTGDGYYFVRLLEKNNAQLSYAYLKIPLTEFNNRFAALKKQNKVKEYISVPKVDEQTLTQ